MTQAALIAALNHAVTAHGCTKDQALSLVIVALVQDLGYMYQKIAEATWEALQPA